MLTPEYISSTNYPPLPEKALADIEQVTPFTVEAEDEVDVLVEPLVPLADEEAVFGEPVYP